MSVRVTFTGVDQVRAKLRAIQAAVTRESSSALYQLGEEIMTEAKRRTPVDTGALVNSGFVERPAKETGRVSVTLGFGGPAVDYAFVVHEDLTVRHPVGQAKYLESAMTEYGLRVYRYLATRVADATQL